LLGFKIGIAEALIKKGKDIISKKKERPFLELMSGNLQETVLQQNANHKITYGETRLVAGRRLERLGKDVRTYQVVGKPLFSAINAIYICV